MILLIDTMGGQPSEEDQKPLDTVGSLDLDFRGSTTIPELKDRHHLGEMKLVAVTISSKSRLLLLFQETIPPPREAGIARFPASRADTKTVAIVADVNWSTGVILDTACVNFGVIGPNVSFIDETTDGFVLVSARCYYGEKNVVIASADGSTIREICYGDGIADIVCVDDEVTAGYIDEGIYGNYGWSDPIGAPGIVKFDLEGNIIWKNTEHPLSEVYAMTIEIGRAHV
jgi:hypothetical protein